MTAHLVGDWLLQNDWMARGKRQGWLTLAGLVHFAVYTASAIVALWLCRATIQLPFGYAAFGAVIFLSHWLIDATNIVQGWMRLFGQSEREMVRMMIDQTLHLLVLAGLTFFLGTG